MTFSTRLPKLFPFCIGQICGGKNRMYSLMPARANFSIHVRVIPHLIFRYKLHKFILFNIFLRQKFLLVIDYIRKNSSLSDFFVVFWKQLFLIKFLDPKKSFGFLKNLFFRCLQKFFNSNLKPLLICKILSTFFPKGLSKNHVQKSASLWRKTVTKLSK